MVSWIAYMPINFLWLNNIVQLFILLLFVHVLPDLWSCFIQTQDSSFRSEPNLILEKVSQLIERDCLVCGCVNPPDNRKQFPLCQEQRIAFEEIIKVYSVKFSFVLAIHCPVHGKRVVVGSPLEIVSQLFEFFENP